MNNVITFKIQFVLFAAVVAYKTDVTPAILSRVFDVA